MTGNVPQPGETPHSQGNPWALTDPDDAWWRGEDDRDDPVEADPPATAARVAGARDLTEHLTEQQAPPGGPGNDLADGSRLATANELMIVEPGAPAELTGPRIELTGPGTEQTRPGIELTGPGTERTGPGIELTRRGAELTEPGAAPRAGVTPLPEVLASPDVEARLERMENSPFWLSEEERAASEVAQADRRPGKRRRPPARNPVAALFSLVTLSLVAAFFGWVSAEPFWLAVGHGDNGYATTTRCQGSGLTQRCTGRFATEDGDFTVSRVTLLGVSGDGRREGAISPARMVSPGSDQAYAAPAGALMHLRWGLGFLLVLICGYGIAETTGARRLPSRPTRRSAMIASFLGPVLLLVGFLISAY